MKIRKNLSDSEMLKGFVEKETFETAVHKDNNTVSAKPKPKEEQTPMLSLPVQTIEKLDKEILQMRIKYKSQGVNELKWQLTVKNDEIILKAAPAKNK